ncbi:dTDP-4-dehydrorhamnose reductase [Falsigemmobacter intermedius]|uniref:dTDP-4-dehydrorhamnose reductase n=1 Tax=Falsigemmobacter intermedius TaxID=1553448 RepID=A0A3S3URI5_9RHOB|nr:dTDP-4-dehydrorhamnose reductase [Falsigemmobacter intermedius]RWY39195.1 dTDP-4-dehydrorhamnose reductase [Falsigemmobacter intermedius]
MKALVFGATGQLAQELRARLPEAVFLSRAEADQADPSACAAKVAGFDGDLVINAAAWTAVDKAEAEEAAALVVNGETPGAIARAAAAKGLPFLHVSTDYVFDGAGTRPFIPDHPTGPLGAYGRTKLAGEEAIRAAGGQHAILRTSWVFSAHGNNFVKTMLRLGATRESLTVVADQIGGPTPAGAIAEALIVMGRAMLADPAKGGTYHFSGAPDVSWADFAREIFAASGLKLTVTDITTDQYPTPAKRPANSRLDCESLKTDFGIARPDWRAALADVLKETGAQS